jgi:tetratricopeptide (TPR) repeat protein
LAHPIDGTGTRLIFGRIQFRWVGLAALLVVAWLAYAPGLKGGFLFDDFVNLNAIGATGPIDDWPTFWRYITSGSADPIGRPIALLSFLVEARDWPAPPYPFLRDNLLLHLINGCLLFALLARLGRILGEVPARADKAALLGAGCWLLHPLFVSTTLYVVQRHAMLPATFVLLGLHGWIGGRLRYAAGSHASGTLLMLAGIVGGTALATASKANGILLPLLAMVLEGTVLRRIGAPDSEPARSRLSQLRLALLAAPACLIALWFASRLPGIGVSSPVRGFSPLERLFTESRVLLDYLWLLAAPRPVSSGLFNDNYAVSRGLLDPWTTLPAIIVVTGIVATAFRLRHARPAVAAALLFFFCGHLLESTILPLELYFEHRNYLPAMLLFWPLALALARAQLPRRLKLAVAALALSVLAITTWQRSSLWGQPEQLAAVSARKQAASSRAQAAAAIAEAGSGQPQRALARLEPLWASRPNDLQIAFNYVSVRCMLDGIDIQTKSRLAQALRHTSRSELMTNRWLSSAIEMARSGKCAGMAIEDVSGWIDAALENPVILDPRIRNQDVEPLLAQLELARGRPDEALAHFDRALRARPSPDTAARQAVMLAEHEYFAQALAHLDTYEGLRDRVPPPRPGMDWLHQRVLDAQGYWPHEMQHLRAGLREALREQRASKP